MFENPGEKIKNIAKFLFYIATICFIIIGISFFFIEEQLPSLYNPNPTPKKVYIIMGILTIILGPLASYFSSLLLYGFGSMLTNTDKLVENTNKTISKTDELNQAVFNFKSNTNVTPKKEESSYNKAHTVKQLDTYNCPNCKEDFYNFDGLNSDQTTTTCPFCNYEIKIEDISKNDKQ